MLPRPKSIRPPYTLPWHNQSDNDGGMSTVEYAIGTVAAAAFGAVLYTVVTGDNIVNGLTALIDRALSVGF